MRSGTPTQTFLPRTGDRLRAGNGGWLPVMFKSVFECFGGRSKMVDDAGDGASCADAFYRARQRRTRHR
jgi:hypothetical protein